MSVKELAQKTGKSQNAIYKLCKELGRLPTEIELQKMTRKRGRPQKWK